MNETRYLLLINRKISAESLPTRGPFESVWPAGQGMRDAVLMFRLPKSYSAKEDYCYF